MRGFSLRFTGSIVLGLLVAVSTSAQTSTASLRGSVRDQSGALIPGVTVTVRDIARNTFVSKVTADDGSYVIPVLDPGTYTVAATLPGFKRYVRNEVVLQVAQVARIDIVLEVGAQEQSVEVVAPPLLLETETSSRGTTIGRKTIQELPLNGRDYNQLATTISGVLPATPRMDSVGFKGAQRVPVGWS